MKGKLIKLLKGHEIKEEILNSSTSTILNKPKLKKQTHGWDQILATHIHKGFILRFFKSLTNY